MLLATDSGAEFINSTLDKFFKQMGIEHQRSTLDNSFQNDSVEHSHPLLKEKVSISIINRKIF